MNPTVEDILALLERIAPAATAADWDNPGLQVGNPLQEVRKVMTSLDPALGALREAARREAQLLLTHHPLIFPSLTSVNRGTYPGNVIFEACKTELAIVAAHTNLDGAQGGINDMLASLFLLQDVDVLQKDPAQPHRGLGRIGDLPRSESLGSIASRMKSLLGSRILGMTGNGERIIKRVAIVGGSGASLAPLASAMGAELLVTGDVSHHDAMRAGSLGLALIDAGHFQTEKTAFALFTNRLKDVLSREGWDVVVETFEAERNPIQWV
jgi:GTP cyclohydrolase I